MIELLRRRKEKTMVYSSISKTRRHKYSVAVFLFINNSSFNFTLLYPILERAFFLTHLGHRIYFHSLTHSTIYRNSLKVMAEKRCLKLEFFHFLFTRKSSSERLNYCFMDIILQIRNLVVAGGWPCMQ